MRRILRRPPDLLPSAAVAAAAVVLQLFALTVGPLLQSSRDQLLTDPATALDYAREPFLALPRLAADFIASALGGEVGDKISTLSGSVGNRSGAEPSAGGASSPNPSPAPPGLLPPLVRADLRGEMQADRDSVSPEEPIWYSVMVRNYGSEASGGLQITSHHPFGTRDDTEGCIDPDGCGVIVPAPVPGAPSEEVHTVGHTGGDSLGPGEEFVLRFRVRVNAGTPSGTELRNHAHIDAVGDSRAAFTTNTVVVTVE